MVSLVSLRLPRELFAFDALPFIRCSLSVIEEGKP